MVTVQKFTKREPVQLTRQGTGVFECEKIRILNTQGREMTTLYQHEAIQLRDELIKMFPQGIYLSDLAGFVRGGV